MWMVVLARWLAELLSQPADHTRAPYQATPLVLLFFALAFSLYIKLNQFGKK
jgi:hypothetical protein